MCICIYLTAVRGRLTAEKSRSEAASEMTKAVVAWVRSLGQRRRATTVRRLPGMEKGGKYCVHVLPFDKTNMVKVLFFCFPWGSPEPLSFGPNFAFLREALAIL